MNKYPAIELGEKLLFLTSGSRGWAEYYAETGAKFLRIQNVSRGRLLLDDLALVQAPNSAEARRTRVQPGDVLLSITADLGRTAVVPEDFGEGYINQHLALLRLTPDLDPRFVAAFIGLGPGRRQIERLDHVGVKSGLNFDDVRSLRLPLPPLPEQRRIADILDKADAIRRKRQEAIRLSEQFLRSTFLEMFGDPVTNPKGWPVVKMGTVATFVGGGTPSRDNPDYFTGRTCWATSKDMKGEHLWDTQEHITDSAITDSATKLVQAGALLVVVKSKVLAHTLPVLVARVPTCFGQDLKAILPSADLPARYLARHLRIGASALLEVARGVNTEGLTLEHLRDYDLMLPPRDALIAHERLELNAEEAIAAYRTAALEAQHLFDALVQRAFRGSCEVHP